MNIEERMNRKESQDEIYIGQILEDSLNGEFGNILRCVINGINADELHKSKADNSISSDRVLGRLEALDSLLDRLNRCVSIKNQLVEEKRDEADN